jgi:hypothetical protein
MIGNIGEMSKVRNVEILDVLSAIFRCAHCRLLNTFCTRFV